MTIRRVAVSLLLSLSSIASFIILPFPPSPIPKRTFHVHPQLSSLGSAVEKKQQLGEFEILNDIRGDRRVRLYDLSSSDPIPFDIAWDIQQKYTDSHLERLAGSAADSGEDGGGIRPSDQWYPNQAQLSDGPTTASGGGGYDSIFMLQHEPVYTLGTGADTKFVNDDQRINVVRINRGGEVTYHGPGQLVVYPILDLRGYKQDIHWYMRALEEAILVALRNAGVLDATREEDVTGVWVNQKKVAALGVKVRRWVTMHGLAVNVDRRSLSNFDGIVPCGLVGREVACVNDFLDVPISVQEFSVHMMAALEEIFLVDLVECGEMECRSVLEGNQS